MNRFHSAVAMQAPLERAGAVAPAARSPELRRCSLDGTWTELHMQGHGFAELCAAVAAAGLLGGPGDQLTRLEHPVHYSIDAQASDTSGGRWFLCLFRLTLDSLPSRPWTTTGLALVSREGGIMNTDYEDHVLVRDTLPGLRVTATYPSRDSIVIVLAGSYVDTLRGARTPDPAALFEGAWTCGPTFPLAADPRLTAHGQDPTRSLPGVWNVGPLPSID